MESNRQVAMKVNPINEPRNSTPAGVVAKTGPGHRKMNELLKLTPLFSKKERSFGANQR